MKNNDQGHFFNRSGIASHSDLAHEEFKEVFARLEVDQANFLNNENFFRSTDYILPRNPLHTWSRVWEYPYIYHHLKRCWNRESNCIIDLGSGVTFFPFAVARLGYNVVCIDKDPVVERDIKRAISCTDCKPGTVSFVRSGDTTVPISDNQADMVYCISVLEHIPEFEEVIDEIARVLRPGGKLLLTIDLNLEGNLEMTAVNYGRLISKLRTLFDYECPDSAIHPSEMLTSESSPYCRKKLDAYKNTLYFIKQYIVKPLLLKKPASKPPHSLLTVMGMTLQRK